MLHPSKFHLNTLLSLGSRGVRGSRNQPVADIDHRFDLQSKLGELCTETIDIDVKAIGIERLIGAPNRGPKVVGSDYPVWCSYEARENQKLGTR